MTLTTNRRESGFTLVELLIVVLIIGILATIAIPIFNGQRDKARNAVAQSTARNALSAAKAFFTQKENYTGLTAVELNKIESTLVPATGTLPVAGTGDPRNVYVYDLAGAGTAGTADGVTICAASAGDRNYCIRSTGASDTYAGFDKTKTPADAVYSASFNN